MFVDCAERNQNMVVMWNFIIASVGWLERSTGVSNVKWDLEEILPLLRHTGDIFIFLLKI
jgi:hypothetical protein